MFHLENALTDYHPNQMRVRAANNIPLGHGLAIQIWAMLDTLIHRLRFL